MKKANHESDPPGDRRVRRTQRQLHEALIALILERGWDAVTVSDICARADVGRSTFYVHFADKENLLLSGLDHLHAAMELERKAHSEPFGFAEPLIVHVAENERLFRALAGRQSGQQVQWRFRDVVAMLVDEELASLRVPKSARATPVRFIAGGFFELIMQWLDKPAGVTPRELGARFRKIALAVVKSESGSRSRALADS
jgi:AcrR family transcriptional regulator